MRRPSFLRRTDPKPSLAGACRICSVSVEKTPKLQTACTTPVADGMVARTNTPEVSDARSSVLEFLLLNQNRIVNREQIAEHVWDENFDSFSNIIDVYIRRLRAKIDAGFERPLIHTRRGAGYILTAEPVPVDD